MPRTLPSAYLTARRLLHKTDAVIELLEVGLTTGTVARIANNREHVTCGGLLFQASSFAVTGVAEDAEGSLPKLSVSVSNVGREPAAHLEAGAIIGQPLKLWIVTTADLSALPTALQWGFTVLSASVTRAAATFEAGPPPTLVTVPGDRYELPRFPGILRRPPR